MLGILPGTGNPALVNLMKYFCTRLATCCAVLLPNALATFSQRLASTSSMGNFTSSSSNLRCGYGMKKLNRVMSLLQQWLLLNGLDHGLIS